jgi:hypothetical protein
MRLIFLLFESKVPGWISNVILLLTLHDSRWYFILTRINAPVNKVPGRTKMT